jgi:hypothetical protein
MGIYVAPYQQPDFRQCLPKSADLLELVEGSNRTGQLRYRDPDTGETFLVPNVHYNQRSEAELARIDMYIERGYWVIRELEERIKRGWPVYSREIPDQEKKIDKFKAKRLEVLQRITDRDAGKLTQ